MFGRLIFRVVLICFTCLRTLVVIEACGRKCSTGYRGITTPAVYMTPAEFPATRFSAVAADETVIREQLGTLAQLNEKLAKLQQMAGLAVSSTHNVADGLWVLLESKIFRMEDMSNLEEKFVDAKITNKFTDGALSQVKAKMSALKVCIQHMLEKDRSFSDKEDEVVPARNNVHEILSLFGDKGYSLWTENLYTSPYLLTFATIHASVATLGSQLYPSQIRAFAVQTERLINVLEEYKTNVTQKRIAMIQKRDKTSSPSHWYHVLYGIDDMARVSVCDHLYYSYCCPGCTVRQEEVLKRTTVAPSSGLNTGCLPAVWNQQIYDFYYNVILENKNGHQRPSYNEHPILKIEYTSRYQFAARELKGLDESYVYDPMTKGYACGASTCLQGYRDVVKRQVEQVFDRTLEFVREAAEQRPKN